MDSNCAKSDGSVQSSDQISNVSNTVSFEFIETLIREIIDNPSSSFFRKPVDPVAEGIPDYPTIVTKPMDLGTILTKLTSKQYACVQDCINDFHQMTANCYKYNEPKFPVYKLCKEIEKIFDTKLEKANSSGATLPPAKRRISVGSPDSKSYDSDSKKDIKNKPNKSKKTNSLSKSTTHSETISSSITRDTTRSSKKLVRDSSGVDKSTNSSLMSYCHTIMSELLNKKHADYNYIFLSPVDPVALQIPDYLEVILFPMDLGTIKNNLKLGRYTHPQQFIKDVRLVFINCYRYNAQNTEVVASALKLQRVFEHLVSLVPKEYCFEYFLGDSENMESDTNNNTARNSRRMNAVDSRLVLDCFHSIEKKLQTINEDVSKLKSSHHISKSNAMEHAMSNGTKRSFNNSVRNSRVMNNNLKPYPLTANSKLSEPEHVEMVEPMTHEEKAQLSINISRLPEHKIKEVISIVNQREPNAKKSSKTNEYVEIDLAFLGHATLRAIEKYLNTTNKKKSEHGNRKKCSAQEQLSRKEELVKRLKTYESQLTGKIPFVFGDSSEIDGKVNGTDSTHEFATRLSESSSSSESEEETENIPSNADQSFKQSASTVPYVNSIQTPQKPIINNFATPFVASKPPIINKASISTNKPTTASNDVKRSSTLDTSKLSEIKKPDPKMNGPTNFQPKTSVLDRLGISQNAFGNLSTKPNAISNQNNQAEIDRRKAEERNKRMALVGKIDMNAQGDLLDTFEKF